MQSETRTQRKWKFATLLILLSVVLVYPSMIQAQAIIQRDVQVRIPVEDTAYNDCTGEDLVVSGYITLHFQYTTDANGSEHFVFQFTSQHVVAIGVTTGTRYQNPGGESATYIFNPSAGSEETDVGVGLHFVGPGPDNNELAILRVHMTFNANGEITANVDRVEFKCNG